MYIIYNFSDTYHKILNWLIFKGTTKKIMIPLLPSFPFLDSTLMSYKFKKMYHKYSYIS